MHLRAKNHFFNSFFTANFPISSLTTMCLNFLQESSLESQLMPLPSYTVVLAFDIVLPRTESTLCCSSSYCSSTNIYLFVR